MVEKFLGTYLPPITFSNEHIVQIDLKQDDPINEANSMKQQLVP